MNRSVLGVGYSVFVLDRSGGSDSSDAPEGRCTILGIRRWAGAAEPRGARASTSLGRSVVHLLSVNPAARGRRRSTDATPGMVVRRCSLPAHDAYAGGFGQVPRWGVGYWLVEARMSQEE